MYGDHLLQKHIVLVDGNGNNVLLLLLILQTEVNIQIMISTFDKFMIEQNGYHIAEDIFRCIQ